MQKKYVYAGEEFRSAWAVKRAIEKAERKRFAPEPDGTLEEKQTFWAGVGVTYTEEPDPTPSLETLKARKNAELEKAFLQWYEKDAVVVSSLGFTADSDARSMMDVSGIVTALEAEPEETRTAVAFMDHNNEAHMLTLEQVQTLRLEIIQNGQAAYQQKWALRTAIENAESDEALTAIVIKFEPMDFSQEAVNDAS